MLPTRIPTTFKTKIRDDSLKRAVSDALKAIALATKGGMRETAMPMPVMLFPTFARTCPYPAIVPAMRAIKIS